MRRDPLAWFWRCACAPEPRLAHVDWLSLPAASREQLLNLGLFREGPAVTTVLCDGCGVPHYAEVVRECLDDGRVRLCYWCPEDGAVSLDPSELRTWKPDIAAVAEHIAAALECNGDVAETVSGRLWSLGRTWLADHARPVWLARNIDATLLGDLPTGKAPVLLWFGTMAAQPDGLAPDAIVPLPDLVRIDNGRVAVDRDAIADQLELSRANTDESRPTPRRADRAATADALRRQCRQLILDFKQRLYQNWDPNLEPPKQKDLAAIIEVSPASVSRALKEDRELQVLWQILHDPEQIMRFRR